MREVTIVKTVFSFNELAESAKQRVLEWNAETLYDGWAEFMIEDFQDRMLSKGIDVENVYWRGFWSQGDGACFEGRIDALKFMKAHKLCNKYRALYNHVNGGYGGSVRVHHSGHYYHEYCVTFDTDYLYDYYQASDKVSEQAADFEEELAEICREYMREVYRDLEKEYDYQTSEEAVAEMCAANDYEFYENGKFAG